MIFTIDTKACTFCGLCADDCPSSVINIDKEAKIAEIDSSRCIECGHCGMICPVGAVLADGKELPPYPSKNSAADELFEHLILSKRSVRSYNNKRPSREDLEAIILAGQLTATATNSRQVDALILQGDEVRQTAITIAKIIQNALKIVRTPLGMMIARLAGYKRYADKDTLESFYDEMTGITEGKSDILFFNAPVVIILTYSAGGKMFGRTDCALAGQNMMLTAHNRGIGSCMIGFAEAALWNKRLRRKVGVAPDRRIGLIFTLGHTDRKYRRYPSRAEWVI